MTPRELAFRVLMTAQDGETEIKDLLDTWFTQEGLPPADRPFATELIYGTVRWRRRLDGVIDALADDPKAIKPTARQVLRLGVYQLLRMDNVPDHAAIHETVELARRMRVAPAFVNALLRKIQRDGDPNPPTLKEQNPVRHLAERYSYPDWIVRQWVNRFGFEEAEQLCAVQNEPAPLVLRTNLLRTTRRKLIGELQELGATATEGSLTNTAVVTSNLQSLNTVEPFQRGDCTVQDESSQLAVVLLDPQPGETILDLCAAPGGKATAIAERMDDRGKIYATDISQHGLGRIRENAMRLDHHCIDWQHADATDNSSLNRVVPDQEFDRVLVDAPCSGLGILRRHADARWRKSPEAIAELATVQARILRNGADRVKLGGVLVYGVCTTTPEETHGIVRAFLEEFTNFEEEPVSDFLPNLPLDAATEDGAFQLYPHRHGTDGFYAIRFLRIE
ncbi:MAG: 16S rRNA (cytosine(967)-C(5))-methyltransferase RsmB [Candidatus Poribacteria bacterium]|nr:16S rRNA (cytosine(967)-C(5))-methyltransferase RsmB [Candidatus Poribacteria bacterium]